MREVDNPSTTIRALALKSVKDPANESLDCLNGSEIQGLDKYVLLKIKSKNMGPVG